jgi:hypothetical protein
MTAELYYRYSKLNKQKQFALVCDHVWIWFHLGANLKGLKVNLYPYVPAKSLFAGEFKLLKKYDYNGCVEIAGWIAKRIKNKTNGRTKSI